MTIGRKEAYDSWHDALAFARAVVNQDFEGADLIFEKNAAQPLAIAVPLAYMVGALSNRLSIDSGVPVNVVWAKLAETIDTTVEDSEGPEN